MEQYMRTFDSFDGQRGERYVPSARIQVMNSVYLPASEVDFNTGRLKPDRQRRCRTQAMRLEKDRLDKEEQKLLDSVKRESAKGGVRVSRRVSLLIVAASLFFCGVYILTQQGIIADRQKALNGLERSIADWATKNTEMEEEIARASDYATICYTASQELNMIPSAAAEAIHLVAVNTRPMEAAQASQSAPDAPGAPQTQSTSVPMLASAE